MKSTSAVALFLLIVTECSGAHSERSRQRSGPIRSVPVAADIKRDVDFDCPEEFGYYPHPTDCTLYYVCVFGGALLESCTGGLMYSHELQTCDWPRNVGCDGTSAIGGEDLERISERDQNREPPPPPPPRRTPPPPPPPRAQPNPVVTSRGQPKFNREEYEKQQQLYAEVDDLPPVEEIESDRQQRVYRGQPSTIGQVQKDRDGYGSQVVSSRTLNANIIPASIPQTSGKIGSFSFGTQVDDRRTATATQAPQTYSLEPTESVTPASYSASPRPKMLYNGSQAYSPDQYDPYYAVYDEDGELYKDTDYVQHYNTASLRPAVQQTYRGTPPPARRPVEAYTPRPSQEDYDDAALIHGQINNQNQYQAPIRHSTRGEGNELGYDNNPSSVKTTLYEATSISTTPSTTSTSTTQRPTTAPFTEAMTPSRYTPRSSTDESPIRVPEPSSENPSDGSALPIPSTPSSMINFSSLAKPFERTDNSHRLQETLTSTEKLLTPRLPSRVSNNNVNKISDGVQLRTKSDNKKVVSLTTGFSIRRNPNNSYNPYTLTVLTRPFDHFNKSKPAHVPENNDRQKSVNTYLIDDENDAREISIESQEDTYIGSRELADASMRRKDSSPEIISEEDDIPIYVRPTTKTSLKPRIKLVPTSSTPGTTKYYLKTVIKRPAPFGASSEQNEDSTENSVNTDVLIEAGLQNARANGHLNSQVNNSVTTEAPSWIEYNEGERKWDKPAVSPYRTLDNLRNAYNKKENLVRDTTTTASTTRFTTTTTPKEIIRQYVRTEGKTTSKPAYYSYRVLDDDMPDQTTEVFSGTVKSIIKAFFDNFSVTPKPQPVEQYRTPTPVITTTLQPVEKVVNIGFQKKPFKYADEKPLRNNVKRLQIITEPSVNRFVYPSEETVRFTERNTEYFKDFSSTSTTPAPLTDVPLVSAIPETTPYGKANNEYDSIPSRDTIQSKFSVFATNKPEVPTVDTFVENSRKFNKIINDESVQSNYRDKVSYNNNLENEVTKLTQVEPTKTTTEFEWIRPTNKVVSEIATTTSTTKSTTVKVEPTTSTTKSISFPTRPSRVNPAIKLAATNPGGGRRSYQSSSKCSSDNSLQANPKCNEIKYQRPTSTRGRGSAHYSTLSGSDTPQQPTANRGTPPTRSRPTLKPSTAVVTNPNPIVDVYAHPPRRPSPVYPQPTPDKTAAKCRKDVCLLPDCYCGGKEIPGNLPVNEVPQIVLMTFDDAVNDLNKMYYEELFEKGRVNPNGCPISATFYVSHEWTDYSQVQNLYADGHELASHTISHSFGEQFSQKKWNREVGGQREILSAYGGVKLEDVRGMRAPFLSVGGNKMFKMLYDSNFTYDSSLPVYENRPPSWPYTLDYKLFHDCMIPPCPTKSYPGVWEVPMVMWQDLNGGRCSMGDACANPPEAEGVYKMLLKNFDRHYTTNRAPFGLFYHAAWFTQPHHKEGFIMFLDFINQMQDVWIITNWQALQWVRDPTPISRLNNFQPFQCNYQDRPKKCNNPKVCNLWHKSGVRYMRTCQPCPEVYPWTGKTGIKSSRIDNDIED
ncbi:mucin-5AC isoform X2 [Pectinophora gossypiella]|uniref:mucin-5AC isoform X2 n=1 Tax=Pectinophora gossypiella TaxID=13191 RepID=UPI00214E2C46|nr:mucin-5AC isoform X2 [Pectinophora gossypiella]